MANCNPGTRQYIGARYVPRHMGEWSADTQYSALDVVLYTDGNSYTAKCYPPKGTVPTDDKYWSLSAQFNQQLAALEDKVQTAENDIQTLENKTTFVTPEQFGAAGDGVTDDSEAISEAVSTGKTVIFNNIYYYTAPIILNNAGQTIRVNGTLLYNGNDNAIIIEASFLSVFINTLRSKGNGVKFNIKSSELGTSPSMNTIMFNAIFAFNHGIVFDGKQVSEYACAWNKISGGTLTTNRYDYGVENANMSGDCIHVESISNPDSSVCFINRNTFENISFLNYRYAVYMVCENVQRNSDMYGNNFVNCSTESPESTGIFYVDGASDMVFSPYVSNEDQKNFVFKNIRGFIKIDVTTIKDTQVKSMFSDSFTAGSYIEVNGKIINNDGNIVFTQAIVTNKGVFGSNENQLYSVLAGGEIKGPLNSVITGTVFYAYGLAGGEYKLPAYIDKTFFGVRARSIIFINRYNSNLTITDSEGNTIIAISNAEDSIYTIIPDMQNNKWYTAKQSISTI